MKPMNDDLIPKNENIIHDNQRRRIAIAILKQGKRIDDLRGQCSSRGVLFLLCSGLLRIWSALLLK